MSDEITQKTSIPIAWAASIIVALGGGVFNAGMAHARFTALQQKVRSAQVRQAANDQHNQERDLRIQKSDIILQQMNKHLESIDKKLDKGGR